MIKIYKFAAVLFALVFMFYAGNHVQAQTASPKGITISPAYQQVSISADEAKKPIHLSVTNDKQIPQTIKVSFSDFNTLNETGGLFFVGSNPTELQKKYGLSKWISINPNVLTLQPKQTVNVDAVVDNLSTLTPGGHYGAINLTAVNSQQNSASTNVSIHPVASSLIFLTKLNGDTHKLSLKNVTFSKSPFSLPSAVNLNFQNVGNTHLIPRGVITIKSPGGKLISKGVINEDSRIILPESSRQYSILLQSVEHAHGLGQYSIEVDYRFDGTEQVRAYLASFWYVPIAWMILPIVVVILFVGIVVYVARQRNANRKQ